LKRKPNKIDCINLYEMKNYTLLALAVIGFCSFQQSTRYNQDKGLKDYYKSFFPVGVAVSGKSITGEEGQFIIKHFNSITPENAMKMGPIHPSQNKYNWKESDAIVAFAQKNKIKVRGHNLCWHEQTPAWIFKNDDGTEVSKDTLLNRLRDHIYTVVKRYKGKIYAWDVVNEAIDDNPAHFLRESPWLKICGEEYIAKAFQYAHEADPQAQLFYNDYNTERPEKRERIFKLVKKLLDQGIPVHAVGLQGHWSLFEPSKTELQETIAKFASLGLKVQVTELDVSVYPWEKERRKLREGEQQPYTKEMEKKQSEKYAAIFNVLRENKDALTGVTFWNVSDRYSWLDTYPVQGRKNYPLLFDQEYKPKQAFWSVVNF
jgi:endo-1,4-beta-xylanase